MIAASTSAEPAEPLISEEPSVVSMDTPIEPFAKDAATQYDPPPSPLKTRSIGVQVKLEEHTKTKTWSRGNFNFYGDCWIKLLDPYNNH